MVPVSKTIVDEVTVMVELFDASIAEGAMESAAWFDDSAVEAEVL